MPIMTLAILALIQGVTEFLPVSSSGHLILFSQLTGTEDQGVAIDVAVHVGTLFAVIIFFFRDVVGLFLGGIDILRGRFSTGNARLMVLMIIATIPVIVAGLVLKVTGLSDAMRNIAVIGWAMLIFGIVLYWFDTRSPTKRAAKDWNLRDAIIMGWWQAVALIPGTSRSGATITGARQLGFARRDGAKIAMLMSIPTIIASAALIGLDLATSDAPLPLRDLSIAAGLAFLSALIALRLMMKFLNAYSFTPYVIYRLIFGAILVGLSMTPAFN